MKQQRLTTLLLQTITVFKCDPLEYSGVFIKACEHGVESKTESNEDRLSFLEQHTSGQPRELIQSCLHMGPKLGYQTAKNLLKDHFGRDYNVAAMYIDKALRWPTIRADDGEALNAFALVLSSCSNAVVEMKFMEKMNSVANMRSIIYKLPYKLREKWRGVAYDIQETHERRTKFKDLVGFVSMQAKMAVHPLFEELTDGTKAHPKVIARRNLSTFTTVATPKILSVNCREGFKV